MNSALATLQTVCRTPDLPDLAALAQPAAPAPTIAMQAIVTLAPGRRPAWVECLLRPANGQPVMEHVRAAYAARGAGFDLDVLDAALEQSLRLRSDTRLGINIHPRSLADRRFVDGVLERARRHHAAPGRLVLELIEYDGPIDLATSRPALERLRAAGVRIALDDFGPGAPNLDVVAAGLIDWIKLDCSLCRRVDTDPGARRVLAGLVAMVRHAGPELVAEGIERAAQMHVLRALGIEHQQGFLFHRPAPVTMPVLPDATVAPTSPRTH